MRVKLLGFPASLMVTITVSGCASVPDQRFRTLDIFESIELEQPKSVIIKRLGKPDLVKEVKDSTIQESLIYEDANPEIGQIAAIELNAEKKSAGVLIIPRPNDPQYNLNYLLETTFAEIDFEKVTRARCGADYDRNQTFFLNLERGIAIEQNTNHKNVSSYSRSAPDALRVLKKLITTCTR